MEPERPTAHGPVDLRYLRLLAQQFPTIQAASTEIINLSAILNLPKGTEHFVSDIHGEYEAFLHVLKNGSGSVKRKIEEMFGTTLPEQEQQALATLIYYPEQKLPLILEGIADPDAWFRIALFRLIKLCRFVSSKYTRSKVRKALPEDFAYIIEELLHEQEQFDNKHEYYQSIIETIISTGRASAFIVAMARLIQRLVIDRLHVIGDIYDRGPGAHIIMDTLLNYHAVDFQWGNHDVVWMSAAAGSEACIANVIRIALRYGTTETLETGYGISLLPLASFAIDVYGDDPCAYFRTKAPAEDEYTANELRLMARMHKAITIIQLKLEAQIIQRRPHYGMQDRLLLDKIDHARGTIRLGEIDYPLRDMRFPTVDPQRPYELTEQERAVIERLKLAFITSDRLQRHVRFLYAQGSMYLIHNGNLLYHGCIPMHDDGAFMSFEDSADEASARAFLDRLERLARQAYFAPIGSTQQQEGMDALWYLWSGARSPLFGKDRMATFERYFIADPVTHVETKNAYYRLRNDPAICDKILREFGLDPANAHIINGHVPVKVKKGESPIKAGGKLLVIDGGFAKAYQAETGIAGYTLISNSYGLLLAAHRPFESTQTAIEAEQDILSEMQVLETHRARVRVKDTDLGRDIKRQIDELQLLLEAYRQGVIKERIA